MEILGVGASELVFVVIIALIVLGPKDMQKAGRTIGKWMRDVVTSDGWKVFQKTSNELRNMPARMMRDANEELGKFKMEVNAGMDLNKKPATPPRSVATDPAPASKPTSSPPPSEEPEKIIQPPSENSPTTEDNDTQ